MRSALLFLALCLPPTIAQAQPAFRAATQAAGASATITYVGAGAFGQRTSCGDVNPTIPAGSIGDGLIALVVARENGATITMAGWALLYADTPAGQEYQAQVWGRVATGGDPSTVNQSGTCNTLIAQIARFDNLDPTTPLEPPGAAASYQTGGSVSSGSITTTVPGSMLVAATFVMANRTVTQAGGWTQSFERADDPAGGGPDPAGISLNYQLQAGTGTFSFSTWDLSGAGNSPNHGVILALRPRQQLTLAVPPGTTAGDVMIAAVAVGPSTTAVTAPAGWTALVATAQAAGNSNRQEIYYRAVSGAEPASYTWAFDAAHNGAVGAIATYSGVDFANPVDVFAGNATPSATGHTANQVATTVANARLVAIHSFASAQTWTPPAGMAERADIPSVAAPNAAGISLEVSDVVQAVAGATGNKTANAAGAADTGVAHLVALRPGQTVVFDIIAAEYNLDCTAFPVEVTILARDLATGDIVPGFDKLVNISTAPATGNWTSGTSNGALLNGAANDGAATYQFVPADSGRIVLRLETTTATALTVTVQDTSTFLSSTSATINFITGGYVIVPDPVQVAGRPQTVTVQHRASPGCGLSTASGHSANNSVKIWLTLDPSHPAGATLPGAAGVTAVNPLPTTEPGANNITLAFSGGQATFTLNTTDVGKYRINIRDTNTARRGSSPALTEKPFALAFPGIQHGTNATAGVLAAAGADFSATVAAYLWQNADDGNNDGAPNANANVTDNGAALRYAWNTTLGTGASLPSPGVTGSVTLGGGAPTLTQASFLNGAVTANNVRYSEVGNVVLTATAENYLDTPGVTVSGDSTLDGVAGGGYVGRFRADHFFLSPAPPARTVTHRIAAACGAPSTFTYMDEAFQVTFRLRARNAQGVVTQNYANTYAKLDTADPTRFGLGAYDAAGPTQLTNRVTPVASAGSFVLGEADVTASLGLARRTSAGPDDPTGPFASLRVGTAPLDSDNVTIRPADADADMEAPAGNDRVDLGLTIPVRFGRLVMRNVSGRASLGVPFRVEAQYWNGSAFALNTEDSCTAFTRSNFQLGDYRAGLAACNRALQAGTFTLSGGAAQTLLVPPASTAFSGSLLATAWLRATPATPPALCAGQGLCHCAAAGGAESDIATAGKDYLLGRWDDAADPDTNANTAYDDNPSARFTFGLFGSQPDNFIFFRENY